MVQLPKVTWFGSLSPLTLFTRKSSMCFVRWTDTYSTYPPVGWPFGYDVVTSVDLSGSSGRLLKWALGLGGLKFKGGGKKRGIDWLQDCVRKASLCFVLIARAR